MKSQRTICASAALGLAAMVHGACGAATNEPAWPFPAAPDGVHGYETATHIGVYNTQAGVLFRKADSALLGIWSRTDGICAGNDVPLVGRKFPVWSLEIMPADAEKPVTVEPGTLTQVVWRISGDAAIRTLEADYPDLACGASRGRAGMRVSLGASDLQPHWRMDAAITDTRASVWSLVFPQLVVPAPDAAPAANRLLIPYRRGSLGTYGATAPKGETELPYPGPAAKLQFMATYGEQSGRGCYYAIEDGAGHSKDLIRRNFPVQNSIVMACRHLPENRGEPGTGFIMPYAVTAGPFHGDWWNAARLYRGWWTNQVWAAKGRLVDRADIPEWLKRTPAVLRLSTTMPARTVSNNVAAALALTRAFGDRAPYGVWYGPFGVPSKTGLESGGHGHKLPPQPGLPEALATLKAAGVHVQAYLQSVIYDTRLPATQEPAERKFSEAAVSRDRQGRPHFYGAEADGLYAMCRATAGWQERMTDLSAHAMRAGFDGIYLDSFGKGGAECFAPGHGHPRGGGATMLKGQRRMAARIQTAVRASNPEAILAGEAPVEAFRDLLDVNLEAVNRYAGYCPVTRAVLGDYSLSHGRTIRMTSTTNNIIPELATLFLEGIIPGRFFCDGGAPEILQPARADDLAYLQKLIRYTDAGLDYLRYGEFLQPLPLVQTAASVAFRESCENNAIEAPGVLHGVYRSPRDGSLAVVLANIAPDDTKLSLPLAKVARPGTGVVRLLADGRREPAGRLGDDGSLTVAIPAHDIVFLILQ